MSCREMIYFMSYFLAIFNVCYICPRTFFCWMIFALIGLLYYFKTKNKEKKRFVVEWDTNNFFRICCHQRLKRSRWDMKQDTSHLVVLSKIDWIINYTKEWIWNIVWLNLRKIETSIRWLTTRNLIDILHYEFSLPQWCTIKRSCFCRHYIVKVRVHLSALKSVVLDVNTPFENSDRSEKHLSIHRLHVQWREDEHVHQTDIQTSLVEIVTMIGIEDINDPDLLDD